MWMALHDNKYTNILCYSFCSFSSFGHLAFQSLLIYLPLKYSVIFSPFFCPATRRDTYYFRLAFSIHVVACYCIYSLLFYTYTQQDISTLYSLLYSALFSRWSTLGRAVANWQGFFFILDEWVADEHFIFVFSSLLSIEKIRPFLGWLLHTISLSSIFGVFPWSRRHAA